MTLWYLALYKSSCSSFCPLPKTAHTHPLLSGHPVEDLRRKACSYQWCTDQGKYLRACLFTLVSLLTTIMFFIPNNTVTIQLAAITVLCTLPWYLYSHMLGNLALTMYGKYFLQMLVATAFRTKEIFSFSQLVLPIWNLTFAQDLVTVVVSHPQCLYSLEAYIDWPNPHTGFK